MINGMINGIIYFTLINSTNVYLTEIFFDCTTLSRLSSISLLFLFLLRVLY